MKIFTHIIMNRLLNFMNMQLGELNMLKIDKFIPPIQEDNLFQNINTYLVNTKKDTWDEINLQAIESIKDDLIQSDSIQDGPIKDDSIQNNSIKNDLIIQKEQERLTKLNSTIDNIDEFITEINKPENSKELENIQAQIEKEQYELEEQKKVQKILKQFYEKEHPELTLPQFQQVDYINFTASSLIHDFIPEEKKENTFIGSHYAFLSDFFPVNNIDISSLLKEVRNSIKQNKVTPATNIYKAWLNYLKDNNENYYLYDWHNFDDDGNFKQTEINKEQLDAYISKTDKIIMYDEIKNKKEQEKQFQEYVMKILSNNLYKSNFKEIQQQYEQITNTKDLYVNQ